MAGGMSAYHERIYDNFTDWQTDLKSHASVAIKAHLLNDDNRMLLGVMIFGEYYQEWILLTFKALRAAPVVVQDIVKHPTRLVRWVAEQMPTTEIRHLQSGRLVY